MTKKNGSREKAGTNPPRNNSSRSFDGLLRNLPGFASQTIAKSGGFFEKLLKAPEFMEQTGKAGRYLKDLRQVAGLTLEDLAKAVDIDNLDLLQAIEEGRSPVTLDILFRLASFYSRNDPITFMMDFSKEYAPWIWQVMRFTGLERLLITIERELKFINIYRSRDSARNLSNEDFDRVVTFMHNAFGMALDFVEPLEPRRKAATQEARRQRREEGAKEEIKGPGAADKRAKSQTKPAATRNKPTGFAVPKTTAPRGKAPTKAKTSTAKKAPARATKKPAPPAKTSTRKTAAPKQTATPNPT